MTQINFVEQSDIATLSEKGILLYTKLYDRVKFALSDTNKVRKLTLWINKYRDKNIEILSSPYIINST